MFELGDGCRFFFLFFSYVVKTPNLGILAHVSEAQAITFSFPHQATALLKQNKTKQKFASFRSHVRIDREKQSVSQLCIKTKKTKFYFKVLNKNLENFIVLTHIPTQPPPSSNFFSKNQREKPQSKRKFFFKKKKISRT